MHCKLLSVGPPPDISPPSMVGFAQGHLHLVPCIHARGAQRTTVPFRSSIKDTSQMLGSYRLINIISCLLLGVQTWFTFVTRLLAGPCTC